MGPVTKLTLTWLCVIGLIRLTLAVSVFNPEAPKMTGALAAWMLSPVLVSSWIAWRVKNLPSDSLIVLLGTAISFSIGSYVVYDVLYIHIDPQGGIALFTIPLLEWLGVFSLSVLLVVARAGIAVWRSKGRSS